MTRNKKQESADCLTSHRSAGCGLSLARALQAAETAERVEADEEGSELGTTTTDDGAGSDEDGEIRGDKNSNKAGAETGESSNSGEAPVRRAVNERRQKKCTPPCVDSFLRPSCVCVCVCVGEASKKCIPPCVNSFLRPSCVKRKGGGWTYESEVSSPSIRRISAYVRVVVETRARMPTFFFQRGFFLVHSMLDEDCATPRHHHSLALSQGFTYI